MNTESTATTETIPVDPSVSNTRSRALALAARMTSFIHTTFKVVALTLLIAGICAVGLLMLVGQTTVANDPANYNAGFFRAWSAHNDNTAIVETNHKLFGDTRSIKYTKNGAYSVGIDQKGEPIWNRIVNHQ